MTVARSFASFRERAVAAFLGLAVGDAYGRSLEFLTGARVRTEVVDLTPGVFRWTDDTHMALYLAEAIVQHGRWVDRPDERDRFGSAVGRKFVEWLNDPLTPSTAPGTTCLRGARAFEVSADYRTSGAQGSDGCGAVMRIAPLAMAFRDDDLTHAAEVSALVTHAHPNALEAAIAGSHLLRWALEGESFDEEHVRRAANGLRGRWSRGGEVAAALEAAIVLGRDHDARWLDTAAMTPDDGGWRAGSALGLAVAAGLAWGTDVRTAIDRAARIDGDSDSVACLVGLFLGAVGGLDALPREFVDAVPAREKIEQLARACARVEQD
jgi:ADP-ribosylglycohydrolase